MSRSNALEESTHFKNAENAEWDWRDQAACKGRTGLAGPAWRVKHNGTTKVGHITISNDKLIEYALTVCRSCRAQWDCVRFALVTNADACTYGVDIEELRWLRKRGADGMTMIGIAEDLNEPVQVMVTRLRRRRSRAAVVA